ncbi:LPS assembly lipoprotein LptE [Oceanicella sp. SM1341]|uniref:LPS assembly lipoprotein LptE n=1 Tax=Oceanicella sp. SM1341 TaxID=1548889 RepID=UPI000E4F861F|nr:LPS assembly lipoprotein LptE [Oceanicella sp. SM1341]
MSWSERPLGRRGLLLGLLALGGCGFRPMYGEGSPARELQGRIAIGEVTRGETPDRMTYAYRDQLRRRLGEPSGAARYRLDTRLRVTSIGLAIAEDNATTRYNLTGIATFSLIVPGTAEPVLTGTVDSYSAYSATGSVYATRIAARDAERRIAEDLAERVITRIAAQADALPA